mmetsp:Transcript_41444/g.103039  ORF Transcript_41444/g.103039 Transcript_41444/m.103039 type:complete len:99 (-) Transcript_41444:1968-2264(-)
MEMEAEISCRSSRTALQFEYLIFYAGVWYHRQACLGCWLNSLAGPLKQITRSSRLQISEGLISSTGRFPALTGAGLLDQGKNAIAAEVKPHVPVRVSL